jgi:regulator of protease activity HflC (stomatin/prohibitin superfamily)
MGKGLIKGAIVSLTGIVVAGVIFGMCITSVDPGYNGIVYNRNGGLEHDTLGQGWHVVAPWKTVIEYPISTEIAYYNGAAHEGRKSDDSIIIGTKDGKTIKVDAQVSYHVADLPAVFNKFRGQKVDTIEYGYMRQNFQIIANDISSQYTLMDIVGDKKPEFNTKLYNAFRDFMGNDGIVVEQAGLGKVEPDEQTKNAIQAVANAQYAQRQAEYEKAAAIAQAQTLVEQAKGNAEAQRLQADAQAYANQKLAQSTDARVVELEWVKKWNGQLPQYMMGSGSGVMVNLNK